jgi:hypothetical protein
LVGVLTNKIFSNNDLALAFVRDTINKFISCLVIGDGSWFHPVTTAEITGLQKQNNELTQVSGGGSEYHQVSIYRTLLRILPVNDIFLTMWTTFQKRSLTIKDLETAFETGKKIVERFSEIAFEFCSSALSAYAIQDWNRALIFSWVVCEQLLNQLWDKHIVSCVSNTERRQRLRDDRVYTAAVQVEVLCLINVISDETYDNLTQARSARNRFIHEGKAIEASEARTAFKGIEDMLGAISGLPVRLKIPGTATAVLIQN